MTENLKLLNSIKGYRIINIPLGDLSGAFHSLYIKEHTDKNKKDGNGRTLFVGNVDYRIGISKDIIDQYLRKIFERFGEIKGISVSSFTPTETMNTKFAHIEFTKKSSLKVALNASNEDYEAAGQEVSEIWGFKAETFFKTPVEIKKMYPFVDEDPKKLKEEVDQFMINFEMEEKKAEEERENALNQVDDDGFITVKTTRNKGKRALQERRKSGKQRTRTKKTTELKNFYRFQIKEEKIKQLDSLRKKFEEDKERVAKLKEHRKFKPF